MGDARDAMLNAAIDMLSAYGGTLPAAQRMGQLACAYQTRLMPAFILAMLKYVSHKQWVKEHIHLGLKSYEGGVHFYL